MADESNDEMIDGTDYEKLRLENIKRNSEFLESIGIDQVKVPMKKSSSSSSKTRKELNKKSSRAIKSVPARRSSRITLISLQNLMDEAKETGNQELFEETATKMKLMDYPVEDQPIQVVDSKTQLLNGEPLSMMKHLFQSTTEPAESAGDGIGEPGNESGVHSDTIALMGLLENLTQSEDTVTEMAGSSEYSKLSLSEEHVTKVTKSRITTSFFHPNSTSILIAAGDKEGHLGLWTPDNNDAVYLYKPHISNVCSIFVHAAHPDQLWSVSYDSTIRYTNIEQRSFIQAYRIESNGYVTDASYVGTNDSLDIVYVSLSSGEVQMIDIRTPNCQWNSEAYDGKLNSIQLHPTDKNLLLTAGKAGYVGLHDVRMQGKKWKPLHLLLGNSHSVNGAAFSTDGCYVVSAGQDNTIQAWSNFQSSSLAISHITRKHNNQTGRWLSTLRPIFDPKLPSTFMIGSMEQPRRIEIFTLGTTADESNEDSKSTKKRRVDSIQLSLIRNLMSDNLGSVCSRNAIHQSLNMVLGGNSSGRVHLFRELKSSS